jgi:hypothetical protein
MHTNLDSRRSRSHRAPMSNGRKANVRERRFLADFIALEGARLRGYPWPDVAALAVILMLSFALALYDLFD